jgi:hypothetical protein
VDAHRGTERLCQPQGRGVLEVAADLRQVEPVLAAGVQVDAHVARRHHVGHEQVGELRRQ